MLDSFFGDDPGTFDTTNLPDVTLNTSDDFKPYIRIGKTLNL